MSLEIAQLANLPEWQLWLAIAAAFFAGAVRGFAGFALSALVMASLALIIPPFELIAVCWILELAASLIMVRPSLAREADRSIVFGLMIGGLIGLPIGLTFTNYVDADVSKAAALGLIIVLATLQLLKVRARFLATRPGLFLSGTTAGFATGIASIGGMVVALYVLARDHAARSMRASLVLYLFANSFVSLVFLLYFGMMNGEAIVRGLILTPPCVAGVFVGKALFTPRLEPYYKPFCLVLLMGLAAFGLLRLAAGA